MRFPASVLLISVMTAMPVSASAAPAREIATGVLEGNIGYIKIVDLKKSITPFVRHDLLELNPQKVRGFIVDLRGNPGGSIEPARAILEAFLPRGTALFRIQSGRGKLTAVTDSAPLVRRSQPVVVLEDEKTNNEADIVSYVLQKSRKSIVVRETPTNSKSLSVYYTQSGRMREFIPIKGGAFSVVPDIQVSRIGASPNDDALLRAIGVVREKSPWEEVSK